MKEQIKNAYFRKKFAEYLSKRDLIGAFFLQMSLLEQALKLALESLVSLGNQSEIILTDCAIIRSHRNVTDIGNNTIGKNISILEQYNLSFIPEDEYKTLFKNLKDFNSARKTMVHNMNRTASIEEINEKAQIGLHCAQIANTILVKITTHALQFANIANTKMNELIAKKQDALDSLSPNK